MMRFKAVSIVLSVLLSVAAAQTAFSMEAAGQGLEWKYTDEHVVLFRGRAPANFGQTVRKLGGIVVRTHPEINIAVVRGLTDAAASKLAGSRNIASASRDVAVMLNRDFGNPATMSLPAGAQLPASHDPTDAFFFPFQWNMRIIDADLAWNAGFDADGIRVAILDTGIDPFHIDMAGNIDQAASISFVDSFGLVPPWGDDDFHGTHVGGTVTTNGFGTSGVAPHATLIAVKVCGWTLPPNDPEFDPGVDGVTCPIAAIISGLVHAANVNADVANMSLGGFINIPAPGGGQLNAILTRAVNFATTRGTLVVSAAGNSAVDLDHIERDFGLTAFKATPCESGNGMCVSATGPTDLLASYSNFGNSAINVAAPGGDFIVSFDPTTSTVMAPCSTLSLDPGLAVCAANGFYVFAQGTSMAAPHVSGAAAMLAAQLGGGARPGHLQTRLQNSADDLGKKGNDPHFGKGRINVCSLVNC